MIEIVIRWLWSQLRLAGVLDRPVNANFEFVFETGVDEMSWDDLSKNTMVWPSVREVNPNLLNPVFIPLNPKKSRRVEIEGMPLWSMVKVRDGMKRLSCQAKY